MSSESTSPGERMKGGPLQDRVVEIAKRVMGELDVDRVLTSALDGIIELCGAERGMILLFDSEGEPLFEKARNLDRRDIRNPEFQVSRSIIRRVRQEGTPFFDPDLPAQPAGEFGDSVYRLGLMAVICLPMVKDGQVFGVAYLDSRSRQRTFTAETLELVATFTEFISLAAHNALDRRRLRRQVKTLERELREEFQFEGIVGHDPAMVDVLELVSRVADSEASVLIEGESGTGKELIARAIHFNSMRRDKRFVPINCGALPETLQESELFGSEKGAFTGSVKTTPGWFESADGGTLFLDEVGEMSPALQVKFLRVLETGEFARVGSVRMRHADVRVVAASNSNLDRLVSEGKIRSDLHFRLCVVKVTVPPLRERRSDIPLLTQHFLKKMAPDEEWRLSPAAEAALVTHPFPGNVRELKNILQRAVLIADPPVIELDDLPEMVRTGGDADGPSPEAGFKEAKKRVVEDFERRYLSRCLRDSEGNITQASRLAGIDVKNFHTKMSRYGIDASEFKKKKK